MRLLVRHNESFFTMPVGVPVLAVSLVAAWLVLRRWRFAAPLRCATVLGLCAGIGGAGLFIILGHILAYLFTPTFSGIQS